jgi:hypothetical protein
MSAPEPLTPAEADLQDFPFMPLQVARLRDSDLAAEAHPEACWYAVLLWSAAWHQVPAGSLPDSDAVLARLCGLGRDVRTFKKHRRDALRGFVTCSDGRLYHPVVAEQVTAAWEGKLHQRHRTLCAAIRKHNERHPENKRDTPNYETWVEMNKPCDMDQYVTALSRVTPPENERDNASKRERQGQGQGQRDFILGPNGLVPDDGDDPEEPAGLEEAEGQEEPEPADPSLLPEHVLEAWNGMAERIGLPKARMTDERRKKLKTAIRRWTVEDIAAAIGAVERNPWMHGENDRGWRADFDFLLQPKSFTRLMEGAYDRQSAH